jgi:hypothetical protein
VTPEVQQQPLAPVGDPGIGRVALLERHAFVEGWSPEQQHESEAALQTRLEKMASHIPEAEQESRAILGGATELIETFQVAPEFFDEPKRSTIFTSLALSLSKTKVAIEAGSMDDAEAARSKAFIQNATFLLTKEHAHPPADMAAAHKEVEDPSHDDERRRILDKYEQPEVTRDLNAYIEKEGILADLQERFASEPSSQTDPDIHVLGIARNPLVYVDDHANDVSYSEAKAWGEGLEKRTKAFAAEFPHGGLAAASEGFATEFHDDPNHHVYIPMNSAELLLSREQGVVPSEYAVKTKAAERVVGTLRHEFVHTKGSVNVGEFGKSLEERRAEYHSGDTGEYYEVKSFFRQLQLLRGRYIGDMLDEVVEAQGGENPISIYEVIGRDFGLATVAEIAAAYPNAYAMHVEDPVTKDMLQSLGGFDAIVERAASDDYVDQERARQYTVKVINNFRSEKVNDKGEPDADYENFLGSYFGPILRGLGMHLADIPYAKPIAENVTQ